MRRSSDSINDVVAKHQQVPVRDWFLTDVAGRLISFVNI